MYRVFIIAAVGVAACSQGFAAEEELQAKIKQLEDRVAQLEAAIEPFLQQQRVATLRDQARERMREDLEVYSQDELREIEQLYQVANQKWRSEEGKTSLKKLVEKFDKANRTGCALLYLGRMAEGDVQIEYLTRAIKEFSDCCYGDGVQVGAYARFVLSGIYRENGENAKADELIEQLKQDYAGAIDHGARPLLAAIDK